MACIITLSLWRLLFSRRLPPHHLYRPLHHHELRILGEDAGIGEQEYMVYLDSDSILLPQEAPPVYAEVDPNPLGRRGRRCVGVLAVCGEGDEAHMAGEGNAAGVGGREGYNRRLSIPLKKKKREWELSLKAILSVLVFFLAIIGIATLCSLAVSYTFPTASSSSSPSNSANINSSASEHGKGEATTMQPPVVGGGHPSTVFIQVPSHFNGGGQTTHSIFMAEGIWAI